MPPNIYSRYRFCQVVKDAKGRLFLGDRPKYGYQALGDNRQHVVRDGETLSILAARYFKPIPDAGLLWWIIADFQPQPILDPTIALAAGQILIVPSLRTVQEEILSPARNTGT